jgi:hypothetical protein
MLKARFLCEKHEVTLSGEPGWVRMKKDDKHFIPSFVSLTCKKSSDEDPCFEYDWVIEVKL